MNRGDIVTAADGGEFTGKPGPYVVVQRQSTLMHSTTVTVCPLTTALLGSGPARIFVPVTPQNGLQEDSEIDVGRIVTIRQRAIRRIAGQLDATLMSRLDAALRLWLDL